MTLIEVSSGLNAIEENSYHRTQCDPWVRGAGQARLSLRT